MAMSSKYGEAYDAEYVDRMVGKVLVQACAAVTLNKPHDPIEYLSLWLHKYCNNAITLQDYENEKQHKVQKEIEKKEAELRRMEIEQDLINQQNSTLNYMRTITNDPYLLWETCIRAINIYTGKQHIINNIDLYQSIYAHKEIILMIIFHLNAGCQAAYVAVVVRKVFEPKPKKKKKVEGEEGEEGEEGSCLHFILT